MNYNYYQYSMPDHAPLIAAWHARREAEGIMHAPLMRLILWGRQYVNKGGRKDRQSGGAVACSFRGEDAERLWNESEASKKTVREYITDRICDALGVPRYVAVYRQRGFNRHLEARARRRAAKERETTSHVFVRRDICGKRSGRGWAKPTQPAGGPYWPCPETRAKKGRVAA